MNKIATVPPVGSPQSAANPTSALPIADLREWLSRVEAIGELTQVAQPVDRDEEMSAISYLVAKQQPSPAVLFERPKGFDKSPIGAKMLWNVLGPSVKRVALTLEEPADTPTVELIRRTKDKLKRRLPPNEVSAEQAPVYQNTVTGKDIDLDLLPIPRHWPLDGGRYAGTADAVITRDPDSGYLNIGTYRMMQQDKSQVGLYLSPGKDARLHITRAWQQGKPIHVAAAWGIDPLFMLVGSQTFPKNVSEYEYAGGIKGQPIPVVRGKTTDLLIPGQRRTGDRRHHPPQFGEVGRTVRRIPRLLRTAGSRLPAGRHHGGALPDAADPDQRADGGLSVLRAERLLLGHSLGQDLGRSRQARHPRHPRRLFASGGGRRLRHDRDQPRAALCRPRRAGAGAGGAGARRRLLHRSGSSRSTRTSTRPTWIR